MITNYKRNKLLSIVFCCLFIAICIILLAWFTAFTVSAATEDLTVHAQHIYPSTQVPVPIDNVSVGLEVNLYDWQQPTYDDKTHELKKIIVERWPITEPPLQDSLEVYYLPLDADISVPEESHLLIKITESGNGFNAGDEFWVFDYYEDITGYGPPQASFNGTDVSVYETVSLIQGSNALVFFYEVQPTATIIVRCVDTSNSYKVVDEKIYTVYPGIYGPYAPPFLSGYVFTGVHSVSDPVTGTIAEGETIYLIYIYNILQQQMSPIPSPASLLPSSLENELNTDEESEKKEAEEELDADTKEPGLGDEEEPKEEPEPDQELDAVALSVPLNQMPSVWETVLVWDSKNPAETALAFEGSYEYLITYQYAAVTTGGGGNDKGDPQPITPKDEDEVDDDIGENENAKNEEEQEDEVIDAVEEDANDDVLPPNPPAGGRLERNDDGSFELIGEDGTPLGRYTLAEDGQTWIFTPYVPMGGLPQTGAGNNLLPVIMLMLGLAALAGGRKMATKK